MMTTLKTAATKTGTSDTSGPPVPLPAAIAAISLAVLLCFLLMMRISGGYSTESNERRAGKAGSGRIGATLFRPGSQPGVGVGQSPNDLGGRIDTAQVVEPGAGPGQGPNDRPTQ